MPANSDRPRFGDWRDAAGEDATAKFMEAVERVRVLIPDLAKIHPDAPALVMRLALEQVAPIAADEVEARAKVALATGWRPAR